MRLAVRVLTGRALESVLDDVAALRISVFREYPYLYDGDAAYERRYLQTYRNNDEAVLVGAFDGQRLVGASTGTSLGNHDAAFRDPIVAAGFDAGDVFYCAESVLDPAYRGRGFGHAFFDARENWARGRDLRFSVFCSVVRANDHPARPEAYRPLDAFWRKRGYEPLLGAVARFSWKEVGAPSESAHDLQFWWRQLD